MIFQYRDFLLGNSGLMTIAITIVLFILLNLILGLWMIYKGIKMKQYTMIFIAAIFFAGLSSWGGVVFNLAYILIMDQFPVWIWTAYFIVQGGFLFIFHFIWIIGIVKLSGLSKSKKTYLLIIVGIIVAVLEGSYWTIIFTDRTLFGIASFPFIVTYSPLSYFYLTTSLMFFVVGICWMIIRTYKSDEPRVRLKSRFLIIYVIGIAFGSILEIYDPIETILVGYYSFSPLDAAIIASYIAKIILVIAVVSGYIGWMLPKRIEKLFLKT
jgi:hypothetical protein